MPRVSEQRCALKLSRRSLRQRQTRNSPLVWAARARLLLKSDLLCMRALANSCAKRATQRYGSSQLPLGIHGDTTNLQNQARPLQW